MFLRNLGTLPPPSLPFPHGFTCCKFPQDSSCFSIYPVIHIYVNCSYQFEYKPPSAPFSGFFIGRSSASPIDSCTYGPKLQNARKSFVALLLPHLFPVSPLLHYSYKKMGGGGVSEWVSTDSQAMLEVFPNLALTSCEGAPFVTAAGRERDMSHGAVHGGLCYRLFDSMANFGRQIQAEGVSAPAPQARQKS